MHYCYTLVLLVNIPVFLFLSIYSVQLAMYTIGCVFCGSCMLSAGV